MKGNQLLYMVFLVLQQCGRKWAGSSVFHSAVHYWPFDRDRGVVDVVTNITGVEHGKVNNIYIKGPMKGFLHTDGGAWEDLGNFTGTCLAEPWRCTNGLTVFLWLKYYPHRNKRYFVGTARQWSSSQGFSIYKESSKRRNNSIVVTLNDGISEWTGYVTQKPDTWLHIALTWDNSTGLALFENCRQIALVSKGKVKSYRSNIKSKFLEQHLTLSGGIKSHPNAGTRASYDDLAVLYRELKQQEWNDICFNKLEAPQLGQSCQSFTRHLVVKWKPPPLSYNILEGFKVCLSGNSTTLEGTEVFDIGSEETSFNFSGLEPGSAYEIRVQNSFRFGDGKASRTIECKTVKEVLDPPANLSVEMTSSTAILLCWNAPAANSKAVLGYKIMYNVLDSEEEFNKVTVARRTSFLITKLSTNTKYRIQIISFSDHRFTDSGAAVTTATTDPYSTKSVTKLKTQLLGARTMQISWNKPPAKYKIFGYRVFVKWSTLDQGENMLALYDGNKTGFIYTLDKNNPSSLTFHVMAHVISEIPLIPVLDPPINITVVSVGWSYLILNWTSPFQKTIVDFADMYRVIITSRNDKIVITTATTYARVDGLKQLTNYFVNVQAWNKLGFGPFIGRNINVQTPDRDECTDGSHVCHMIATCANTVGSYTCECKPGYIGDGNQCKAEPEDVGDDLFCPKQSLGNIEWINTLVDRQVVMRCPDGTVGHASRSCNGPDGVWQLPDLSDCVSAWVSDISQQLTSPNVSVLSVAKELSNFTNVKYGRPLYAGDLKLLVDAIGLLSRRGFYNSTADESKSFVEAVVGTASNILDNKNLKSWTYMPKDSRLEKAGSLITSLDTLALYVANSSQREPEDTDNVVISATSLSEIRNLRALEMRQNSANEETSACAVLFPASVIQGKHSNGEKPSYATFVSYKTLGPLLTPIENKSKDEVETMTVNSAVVSLNLQPLIKRAFKDPVVITLRHSVENEGGRNNPTCAFLQNEKNGSWSKAGCKLKTTNITHTICHCYHLTSFAVLMSVRKDVSTSISEEHQLALSLITYVGVSISIVALILAFLTFHFFRFSTSARTFIHKHLAVSLIFAQLVFLFGIGKTANQSVCKAIAVALHYFFLVSFSWMALEGVMLYLMLVKVFHTKTAPTKTKKIFFCIGWGLPIAIVVTSGVLYHEGYGTSSYCWLTLERGFIWSFVGPVLLVLMFNFVILGMTFNVMARRGPTSNKRRTSKIRKWSKACMLLTCILGLTWLFGVFYINQESLFMAYFFTIFNTLQGLFIFLFHCIGDAKVRREYRRVLCCVSRAKQPLLSSKSDTSKSESSFRPSKTCVDHLKNKNQTISSSASSLGTIESRKNTFVVHVTDGQVRVRGVPLDNSTSDHMTTQRQSQASFSSFGQPSEQTQNRDSIRHSIVSRGSEFRESKQEVQTEREEVEEYN